MSPRPGKAKSVTYEIAGSGDIDAKGLVAETARVSIAGSGNVGANATGDRRRRDRRIGRRQPDRRRQMHRSTSTARATSTARSLGSGAVKRSLTILTMCGEGRGHAHHAPRSRRPPSLAASAAATPAPRPTRNYSVTDFDRIRLDGPYKVRLVTDVAPFARASGSQAALDGVAIEVQGRTLSSAPTARHGAAIPAGRRARSKSASAPTISPPPSSTGRAACRSTRSAGCRSSCAFQGAGAATIAKVDVDQLKVGISGSGQHDARRQRAEN